MSSEAFQARVEAVRERVDIVSVVRAAGVALSKGKNPRGKCPFHGSKSASFAVYADKGFAKCWGCPFAGDAIRFVSEHYGLSFIEALERLEGDLGLDGLEAKPKAYQKAPRPLPA